ncbi:hypothetical protein D3C75_812910 [compost metagenome]
MFQPSLTRIKVVSFICKFIATDVTSTLTCLGAESLRFARRLLRALAPSELAQHPKVSDRHARRILHELVQLKLLDIASGGQQRNRTYQLNM